MKIILVGDLNIDYLKQSKKREQLDILLNMYDLIVMTKQPTGVNEGTMTAIDYIIINPQVWNSIVDIHDTGLSDHYAQLVYLECIYLLQKT